MGNWNKAEIQLERIKREKLKTESQQIRNNQQLAREQERINKGHAKTKKAIADEIKAYQEDLEREAENTTLARFIRNLESRIYAQLSRQLVDNLFGETPSESGTLELEGNKIEYTTDGDFITLIITDSDGNTTEITLPIGNFAF